jgi:hypothetical protein
MSNNQIETREIADGALDSVVGGSAGLLVEGQPGQLSASGGAELAGHGVAVDGGASLQDGQAGLNVTAA